MPSKVTKLSAAAIAEFETKRDLGTEILQSIRDMKAGKCKVVLSSVTQAREATGLSQSQFASLLGVSDRTLPGWEQGRKQPSGAARTLLAIASIKNGCIVQPFFMKCGPINASASSP